MRAALVILTNGRRDCIERTIPSLEEQVSPLPELRLIFDDSGDATYRAWLAQRFDRYVLSASRRALGYAPAMRRALDHVATLPVDWVWISEDDFLYRRPVGLLVLAGVMEADPKLAQVVLRRQPWFPSELRSGDMIGRFPAAQFEERSDYLRHRQFFSMNPHLIRRETLARFRWPLGASSERRYGERLFHAGYFAGLWGGRHEPPWVEHVGRTRVGTGY